MPQPQNRELLLWLGLVAGLLIFAVVSIALINRNQRISANRDVSRAVAEAEALIGRNQHEEAITLLAGAIRTPYATDFSAARGLLDKARVAKADYGDARFIMGIERALNDGRAEPAPVVDPLERRVATMREPNKSRAIAIIEQVTLAASQDRMLDRLSYFSDEEINDAAVADSLVSRFQTSYDSVRKLYRHTLVSALPGERARRQAAKDRAEAERLEQARRKEAERVAKLEQERTRKLEEARTAKEAEEKRLAEEARLALERKARDAERLALEERRKRSFRGSGDEATAEFALSSGLAVVTLRHRGLENFAVWLLDNAGDRVALLANVIGPCSISTALRIPRNGRYVLDIKADRLWEITIAQPLPHEAEFHFVFSGDRTTATRQFKLLRGLCKIKLKHRGEANFVVRLLDDEGQPVELVANTIGTYDGSRAVKIERTGTYLFAVTADGEWSIELD